MHLYGRQLGQDVRHRLDRWPVELDVLAGAEMAVAAVVGACNVREHAHLLRGERAVRDGYPQHRRESLDVETILQAQRTELVLTEFAGEVAPGLVPKLGDTFVNQSLVVGVVLIHGQTAPALAAA